MIHINDNFWETIIRTSSTHPQHTIWLGNCSLKKHLKQNRAGIGLVFFTQYELSSCGLSKYPLWCLKIHIVNSCEIFSLVWVILCMYEVVISVTYPCIQLPWSLGWDAFHCAGGDLFQMMMTELQNVKHFAQIKSFKPNFTQRKARKSGLF